MKNVFNIGVGFVGSWDWSLLNCGVGWLIVGGGVIGVGLVLWCIEF